MPPRAWRTATAFVRWLQASSLIQYIYISSHLLTSSYFWQYCLSEKKGEDKKKRKKDWEDPLHFFSVCVWPAISRGFLFFEFVGNQSFSPCWHLTPPSSSSSSSLSFLPVDHGSTASICRVELARIPTLSCRSMPWSNCTSHASGPNTCTT